MDKPAKLRLFFGLELPEPVKQRLLSVQRPVEGARWQRADQLHLTLAFLGSLEARLLPRLFDAARDLPIEPFALNVTGIGCFGHPDRPKNVWAGVRPKDELAELKSLLSQRLAYSGFAQEKRTFRPHVTLARFRKETGSVRDLLQNHHGFDAGTFCVHRLALFESITGEQGSVYQIIERFALPRPE